MNPISAQALPEEDQFSVILSDLKRIVREYATAATESVCPEIRQMFTNLTNNTLRMQGELYNAMKQNGMYNASSPVLRQEIDKQIRQYEQDQQKTAQFLQQRKSAFGGAHPGAMLGGTPSSAYQQHQYQQQHLQQQSRQPQHTNLSGGYFM